MKATNKQGGNDMFGVNNIMKTTWGWMAYGFRLSQEGYKHSRVIGWGLVTVGLVTILPLIFEIKREILVEEFEQMTIGKALSEGQTRLDLFHSGLASALEPKVLKG